MRNDIDYVGIDGEGLEYGEDWITPSHSKGYRKLRLTDSVSVYYREEGHFVRYNVVLSFDHLAAHAPRSLPILLYGFVNMLEVWDKLEAEDDRE